MKNKHILSVGLFTFTSMFAASSFAAITGQVDVKLNISSGCTVDNSQVEGNMNKFGVLDFGKSASTWSNVLTAEVASTGNGGDLTVSCDAGVTQFNVSVNGGERGDRTLSNATDTVSYNVYQDAARSKLYELNTNVPFTPTAATPVKVPMYGAIAANATAVSEGDYTDTLLVTVSF
ncbi:spore coat protein U domain-containing protein [Acinetobacter gerneri]|jgi:spore coat protein U-like protein|uniref:Spore coat protein U domain-containing protein n=1 Tax=Acinetobacter gerneri TaxID=202952 RepID=A0AAW8JE47_9GAMM|nr:spore coat protein U domain-containing protein [Acinetobacter gerneri]MCH4246094.1 spore coat U domain-containing protein [Acinetobacter gerneri]MDQ9009097.1 spore coat protein U domain-containing protein [Acinetobacter gerneri]MDQ9013201.1 spore coat protein U domain-containing protein [Acinetobacter gerneri]MDQ9024638.1 spore coat protein U domain-containing protein [Acinetobacter gerneri]MDQ9051873.1 spore coat protein U domain-containing protein [Acinetobacter gerneri]